MSEVDAFRERFGTAIEFEACIRGIESLAMDDDLNRFHGKARKSDKYEISRQNYLKLLSQNKMIWENTNGHCDLEVQVSRIYRKDREEYVAFMRIHPRGFRAERVVPVGIEMSFHLLIGQVIFTYKRQPKIMNRGQHVNVKPRTTYSIRCPDTEDQPAYLIFQVKQRKPRDEVQQSRMDIPN